MKRDLSILLIVLMIFSLGTINIKADDNTEIDLDLIEEWEEITDSLSDIYFADLSDVEYVKADIKKDNEDLNKAITELNNSKQKSTNIIEAYNVALENRNEATDNVSNKEAEVKKLEDSLSLNLQAQRTKLEELTKAEQEASDKAINTAPGSESKLAKLKDQYETSELNVANCEYQLNKAKENLELLELFGDEDFIVIAKSEVESWTNKLASAKEEYEDRKKTYDDAVATNELLSKEATEALDNWNSIVKELSEQEELVTKLEKELENNEAVAKLKEELYALQFTWAEVEDTYIKAKEKYDDINSEIDAAQLLVDTLKDDIKAKETLLEICNEDLNESKAAYDEALEYLNSITEIFIKDNKKILKELVNKKVNYKLYSSTSVDYCKAILEDSTLILNSDKATAQKVADAIDNLNEAYEKLTLKDQVGIPDVSIKEGTYETAQTLTISPSENGKEVIYTVNDGKEVSSFDVNTIKLSGELNNPKEYIIKAYTVGEDKYRDSDIKEYKYVIDIKQAGEVKTTEIKVVDESTKKIEPKLNNAITPKELTEKEEKAIAEGINVYTTLEVMHLEDEANIPKEEKELIDNVVEENDLNVVLHLDIQAISTIEGTDEKIEKSETNEKVSISITVPDEYIDNTKNRVYKVIRIHDNNGKLEKDIIEGTFNKETNKFTFETDKFSTYTLVYEDIKEETKKDNVNDNTSKEVNNNASNNVNTNNNNTITTTNVNSANTSGNNIEASKSCEDAIGRNWTWNNKTKTCVYRVSNTSSK